MADRVGCGKPMGRSGYLKCFCGMVGVPLCRECKAKAASSEGEATDGSTTIGPEGAAPNYCDPRQVLSPEALAERDRALANLPGQRGVPPPLDTAIVGEGGRVTVNPYRLAAFLVDRELVRLGEITPNEVAAYELPPNDPSQSSETAATESGPIGPMSDDA